MNLSGFVHIEENVFDDDFCESLIQLHKSNQSNLTYGQVGENKVNHKIKKSIDYNLSESADDYLKYGGVIVHNIGNSFEKYSDNLPHQTEFQTKIEFFAKNTQEVTVLQIQKYEKGEGHYNSWHYENANIQTSLRTFVFILYLNDVNEGGETEILFANQKIQPKRGTLVIHPSFYPFVHRGNTPISDDKYILTGWMQYSTNQPQNL